MKSILLSVVCIVMMGVLFSCTKVNAKSDIGSNDNNINSSANGDTVKLSDDSSGFVLLSDAVPDVILEIRYYSTYNFVGERIDGYEEPLAFMTKEAATKLKEANDELMTKGSRLKIYDAYRPQSYDIKRSNVCSWI